MEPHNATLTFIRDIPHPTGQKALYRLQDGSHVVVSTISHEDKMGVEGADRAIVEIVEVLGLMLGDTMPAFGEETMAFPADPRSGEPTSWTPIASSFGDGSRERVLEQLRE